MPEGVYGPATLRGVGPEPLSSSAEEWVVQQGQELIVEWSAPEGEAPRTQVLLTLAIDQHGSTPGTLRCLFEDTGLGTVPAGAVDALVSAGVTGFPSGSLERRTADQAPAGGGCMDLVVSSRVEVDVDVGGFTPCLTDEECPDGLECNIELQICE